MWSSSRALHKTQSIFKYKRLERREALVQWTPSNASLLLFLICFRSMRNLKTKRLFKWKCKIPFENSSLLLKTWLNEAPAVYKLQNYDSIKTFPRTHRLCWGKQVGKCTQDQSYIIENEKVLGVQTLHLSPEPLKAKLKAAVTDRSPAGVWVYTSNKDFNRESVHAQTMQSSWYIACWGRMTAPSKHHRTPTIVHSSGMITIIGAFKDAGRRVGWRIWRQSERDGTATLCISAAKSGCSMPWLNIANANPAINLIGSNKVITRVLKRMLPQSGCIFIVPIPNKASSLCHSWKHCERCEDG